VIAKNKERQNEMKSKAEKMGYTVNVMHIFRRYKRRSKKN